MPCVERLFSREYYCLNKISSVLIFVAVIVVHDDLRVWTGSALLLLDFPVFPQVSKVAP